jgi:hypothetical protein
LVAEGVVQRRHATIHLKAEKFDWIDFGMATPASHDFG